MENPLSTQNLDQAKDKTDIYQKTKHLAELLKHTDVYQELLRMGNLISMDPEVNRILNLMRQRQYGITNDQDDPTNEELETQLLALPAYQAYLKAENSARELFQSVDRIISKEAGINFAENAKRQGCGCGS
jgi:cell fate (sporulation/competence/biofilm development) regulator YlbF (YheA/YmcA/DUF963 family)